jgi:hypothetical protein
MAGYLRGHNAKLVPVIPAQSTNTYFTYVNDTVQCTLYVRAIGHLCSVNILKLKLQLYSTVTD